MHGLYDKIKMKMITLENAYENDGSDDDIVEDMYT